MRFRLLLCLVFFSPVFSAFFNVNGIWKDENGGAISIQQYSCGKVIASFQEGPAQARYEGRVKGLSVIFQLLDGETLTAVVENGSSVLNFKDVPMLWTREDGHKGPTDSYAKPGNRLPGHVRDVSQSFTPSLTTPDGVPRVEVLSPKSGARIVGNFHIRVRLYNLQVPEEGRVCFEWSNIGYGHCFHRNFMDNLHVPAKKTSHDGMLGLVVYLEYTNGTRFGSQILYFETLGNSDTVKLFTPEATTILFDLISRSVTGADDSACHAMSIFGMSLQIQAARYLELGVRTGVTTLPLLLAANFTRGTVDSVDIEATPFVPPDSLAHRWNFHEADALEWLADLEPEVYFDLVWIDDEHSKRHVDRELELLAPHVDRNTIILVHDTMAFSSPLYSRRADMAYYWGEAYRLGGPYDSLIELDSDEWEFSTVPVCHGMTLLRKKGPFYPW